MSYVVTYYTRAVATVQSFHNTKKEAQKAMAEDIKEVKTSYPRNSGYKKVGSIASGRVSFEHPYYGADYVCKLEKNSAN